MRTSSKISLVVGLVALALLLVRVFRPTPPSPQTQIAAQIASAIAAANSHDVNGIMAIVSADYADANGYDVDAIHLLLVRSLRGQQGIQVSMPPSTITVQGNKATSQGFLTVQDTQSGQTYYSHEVTLQWQEEPARAYLIYPTTVWRVTSASYGSIDTDIP